MRLFTFGGVAVITIILVTFSMEEKLSPTAAAYCIALTGILIFMLLCLVDLWVEDIAKAIRGIGKITADEPTKTTVQPEKSCCNNK